MGNAHLALEAQNRAARAAVDESIRAASKDGAPPTTAQDVEAARRYYVQAIDQLERLFDSSTREFNVARQRASNGLQVERDDRRELVEFYRLKLDEVRERFEAQERQKARDADAELAKANHELAKKQTELAAVQAEAAKAQVQIAEGTRRAAWFAGVAAAAAVLAPLFQSCRH